MKANRDFHGDHFLFRRDQVLSSDFREFLSRYDPRRLGPFELRRLIGFVSIELEQAAECGDLFSIPEARTFVGGLNAAWPWAGFFLDLKVPLGPGNTLGALPILAYALCLTDLELIAWDRSFECTLRLNKDQFLRFRDQCFRAIATLGHRAEIPAEVLLGRQSAVSEQLNRVLVDP